MFFLKEADNESISAIAALERLWSSAPWSEDALRSFCAQKEHALLLVCCRDGAPIAYLALRFAADTGEIDTFAVAPDHRRQGAGEALLREAIRQAGERGVKELFLEVRASNLPARALYEKLGFTVCGRRPRFYKDPEEDALLYRIKAEKQRENPGH